MSPFNKICIVLKPNLSPESIHLIQGFIPWLHRRKKTVIFLEKERERLKDILKSNFKYLSFVPDDYSIYNQAELIVALGGDGTLIGVSRKLSKTSPPVFGVNMGHLGFITEFSRAEFFPALEATLRGEYEITKLSLYEVEVTRKGRTILKSYFLNDAVIHNGQISRMLTLSLKTNGEHIYSLSGDGLIISSPIGSTAYSLAAGGPIIHPHVNAMTLTPVCAHSLTHRPLVVPDDATIEVSAIKGTEAVCITLDGQEIMNVLAEDTIKITRPKNKTIKLIKNPKRTYFHTLKEKFTHGERELK